MARARKKATEPVHVEAESDTLKVTVEAERTSPDVPPAEPSGAKREKAPRRSRARKQPAKSDEPAAAPVPTEPGLGTLLHDTETLRHQLGDAGRQAEETRLVLQSVRHQHEELTRQVEALHGETRAATEEAVRQAAQVRGQVEGLKEAQEEASREIAGLRQHVGTTRQELQQTLKSAGSMRTELEAAAQRLGEAERLFRETAQQLVADLRNQVAPIHRTLQEVAPPLEAFPEQTSRVLERLEQTARTLPDALLQMQRLEQQGQEQERRLAALREEAGREEARLEALRQASREAEGRLGSLRDQVQQVEGHLEEVRRVSEAPAEAGAASEAPRPKLGLTVGPGVIIDEVVDGSAGHAAGLSVGDVIQAVNGIRVTDGAEVRSLIQAVAPGEPIVLSISRGGESVDSSVTLLDGARENGEEGKPYLGLTVHPGVVVAEVLPGSPAEAAGLARGDVIQTANGTPVLASEQLRQAVLWEQLRRAVQTDPAAAEAETELSLEVSRSGRVREIKVPLPLGQPPLSA